MGFLSDIIGSITGGNRAERGGREGAAASREMFDIARTELRPFMDFGMEGMGFLRDLMGDPSSVMQLPFFQFLQDQGMQGITRSAAASGFRGSGNVLHELQQFGQGLASTAYGDQFNRMFSLANLGAQSAGTLAGGAVQTGGFMSDAIAGGGRAAAQAQGELMSGVAQGLGTYFGLSDRELKYDIELIAEGENGINLYKYKYLGSTEEKIGVMADEVEKVYPDAIGVLGGYKYVDYQKLKEHLNA